MLEIIHPDLCLVGDNANGLFSDGTNDLLLKIWLKITYPINVFHCQLIL